LIFISTEIVIHSDWLIFISAEIDIQIPSFDGHSYLQYIGLRRTVLTFAEIELVFSPSQPDGVLLYNGYATDGTGDFLSLALRNGTVEYRFDLGTGSAVIRFDGVNLAWPDQC